MVLASGLRYGENPHQGAAFYLDRSLAEAGKGGVATSVQHHGKEMSYNNYLDADAAYGCACDYAGLSHVCEDGGTKQCRDYLNAHAIHRWTSRRAWRVLENRVLNFFEQQVSGA